jgi:hypothetical protein
MFPILAKTIDGQWHPGIGDPTIGGWLTVVAYFVAIVLAVRAARSSAAPRVRGFWWVSAAILLLLCINKQLDLQTWLTEFGRRTAIDDGWYDQRAVVQRLFIAGIVLAGIAAAAVTAWLVRKHLGELWLALAGGCFLIMFVIVRATSIHHVDQLLGMTFGETPVNWILEIGGILTIAAAALGLGSKRSAP